jgi:hypothetical protein
MPGIYGNQLEYEFTYISFSDRYKLDWKNLTVAQEGSMTESTTRSRLQPPYTISY